MDKYRFLPQRDALINSTCMEVNSGLNICKKKLNLLTSLVNPFVNYLSCDLYEKYSNWGVEG